MGDGSTFRSAEAAAFEMYNSTETRNSRGSSSGIDSWSQESDMVVR